jgi:GNAT superfamily N-acetyltransferase
VTIDIEIRPVRPEEHEAAGELVVAAYAALPGEHMSDGYSAELRAVTRRAEEAEVLVALVPGVGIAGCVTLVTDLSSPWAELLEPREAGIRMLAVDPAAQGRGIGRALLAACIDRARALGCEALMLHTTPWMPVAHRLYESSGFERVVERDFSPVPEVPLLAYRLAL